MNIAGVLVHSRPDASVAVQRALAALPGVEVHAADDGRIVVTVEGDDADVLADTFRRFHDLAGVLSAAMVYHHFEPDSGQES